MTNIEMARDRHRDNLAAAVAWHRSTMDAEALAYADRMARVHNAYVLTAREQPLSDAFDRMIGNVAGLGSAVDSANAGADKRRAIFVIGESGSGKTTAIRRQLSLRPQFQSRLDKHGREIFPLLTVEENLKTGYAALKRADRYIPHDVFSLFPVLQSMLGRRGGDLSGGQQQQLAIGRALVMRPRLLLLDEPTEGIQPSIIKDIGRAISYLRSLGTIAIVLVEQYLDFACELGDNFAVMDRGAVKFSCDRSTLDPDEISRAMAL